MFLIKDLEGLSYRQIADILDISLANVNFQLHRARAKLKAALDNGCDFYHIEENTLVCDRKQSGILPKMPK